jgi:hypothetical protein
MGPSPHAEFVRSSDPLKDQIDNLPHVTAHSRCGQWRLILTGKRRAAIADPAGFLVRGWVALNPGAGPRPGGS